MGATHEMAMAMPPMIGSYDRPWGESPIFGMVRYMLLEGLRRKTGRPEYPAGGAALKTILYREAVSVAV